MSHKSTALSILGQPGYPKRTLLPPQQGSSGATNSLLSPTMIPAAEIEIAEEVSPSVDDDEAYIPLISLWTDKLSSDSRPVFLRPSMSLDRLMEAENLSRIHIDNYFKASHLSITPEIEISSMVVWSQ